MTVLVAFLLGVWLFHIGLQVWIAWRVIGHLGEAPCERTKQRKPIVRVEDLDDYLEDV